MVNANKLSNSGDSDTVCLSILLLRWLRPSFGRIKVISYHSAGLHITPLTSRTQSIFTEQTNTFHIQKKTYDKYYRSLFQHPSSIILSTKCVGLCVAGAPRVFCVCIYAAWVLMEQRAMVCYWQKPASIYNTETNYRLETKAINHVVLAFFIHNHFSVISRRSAML